MSNLNFFKGNSDKMPITANRKPYSFYLVEDTNDFYYSNKNKSLIKMATDPSTMIKEIYTLYSTTSSEIPDNLEDSNWTKIMPTYKDGEQIYSV
jgi:hypothetical protein